MREGVRITATPRIGKTWIADCGLRIADFLNLEIGNLKSQNAESVIC